MDKNKSTTAYNEYMKLYMREYRKAHREKINAQRREWNKNNPDKIRAYTEKYRSKKLGN